jgi:lysozyme
VPRTSAAGIALIKRFEGLRLKPYRDAAGHLTIGYGHRIRPGESFAPSGLTPAEAEALLAADLAETERAVAQLAPTALRGGPRDALVAFAFNLGAGALRDSTLMKKVEQRDEIGAALEFVRWIHAAGADGRRRPLKGLLRRRLAEAALFLSDGADAGAATSKE